MPRVSRWRLFLTLVVVGGAVYVMTTTPVQLGLDLRGGTQILLEAQDTAEVTVDTEVTERTLEVLRRRVDAFGVAEPTLQLSGNDRIIIELPGVTDPDEALEVIGRTAQLTFHPVLDARPPGSAPAGETPEGLVLPGDPGEELVLGPTAVSGEQVDTAAGIFDSQGTGQWVVSLGFHSAGERAWEQMTAEAACFPGFDPRRRVAIVLDSQVISSPGVAGDVACNVGITGGSTIITGRFDQESAEDLALLIRAGALPVPVEVIEQATIGPSLGEAAIAASVEAAIIGGLLTILYMIAFYRLMGMAAALSLLVYGTVSYAVLASMGATLTLPGIAGFVLAIGMAVDANVLVYERAKEEFNAGAPLGEAVTTGFKKAWSAIADANVTTLIAALLLFAYASGAVRGFGVTLSVGVVVSMFSALVVTRLMLELLSRIPAVAGRPGLMGMHVGRSFQRWLRESGPDLMARSRRWLLISVTVVVVAGAGLVWPGPSFGVEFLGGRLVEFSTTATVDIDELRTALTEAGLPRALIQESGHGTIIIRSGQLDSAQEETLELAVGQLAGEVTVVRDQFVGPTLGVELRNRALMALGLALVAQLAYLAIRFRWTTGLSAVTAMFHDVIILLGAFAWLGKAFDGVFLASLLTVIGYSINDSVVIFDRIREQRSLHPESPVAEVANDACLQTIPRTVNTGMGALLILIALFVLGGDTLSDFALALIIGTVVGSYSSIFTATPIAIALENRFPAPEPEPEPARARRTEKPKRVGDRRIFE